MAAPPRDSGFDPVRAGGAVLAVLALLAVVALAASAGGPATGGAGRDLADPLATLLFVLGGVWVAALLVASPLLTGLTLTGGEPKQRRWHGNVFAGENMLETMAAMVPGLGWLLPIPFYFMELLVGLVQAMVFMLLTAVFTLLICHHEEAGAGAHT